MYLTSSLIINISSTHNRQCFSMLLISTITIYFSSMGSWSLLTCRTDNFSRSKEAFCIQHYHQYPTLLLLFCIQHHHLYVYWTQKAKHGKLAGYMYVSKLQLLMPSSHTTTATMQAAYLFYYYYKVNKNNNADYYYYYNNIINNNNNSILWLFIPVIIIFIIILSKCSEKNIQQ